MYSKWMLYVGWKTCGSTRPTILEEVADKWICRSSPLVSEGLNNEVIDYKLIQPRLLFVGETARAGHDRNRHKS